MAATKLSSEERRQSARIAALSRWAKEDPVKGTEKARRAFFEKFIDEADPDRELPEEERLRRAEAARRAHMARMAYRSARGRRRHASSGEG